MNSKASLSVAAALALSSGLGERSVVEMVKGQKLMAPPDHPLSGMRTVRLNGDERRFELSEKAKQRREWAKKAKKNYVKPSFRKGKVGAKKPSGVHVEGVQSQPLGKVLHTDTVIS